MRRRDFMKAIVGSAAGWPLVARAQQSAMPVIGFVNIGGPEEGLQTAFQKGLRETGYNEGQNVAIEYRWAEGRRDRLPGMVTDLVGGRWLS